METNIKTMWEEFIVFLKKHRVYKKYMSNLRESGQTVEYMKAAPAVGLISWAFVWRKTPEGHEFWEGLDDIWCKDKW